MVTLSSLRQLVETQQGTTGLDSAEVTALAGSGGGVVWYDTLDSLPSSSLSAGDEAFVEENKRLYVSDGSGWYNVALVNRTPRWGSGGEPDASYEIVDSATPLVITAKAIDSDNPDSHIVSQSFGSDSAQYMVDITNDSSVFTFTPKSADSIGTEVAAGNLTESNGDFVYTFKYSDGINFVSKAVTIAYNVVETYTDVTFSSSQPGFAVDSVNQFSWSGTSATPGNEKPASRSSELSSGRKYMEINITSGTYYEYLMLGLCRTDDTNPGYSFDGIYFYPAGPDTTGYVYNNGSYTTGIHQTSGFATPVMLRIAYDTDNNQIWIAKNSEWWPTVPGVGSGAALPGTSGAPVQLAIGSGYGAQSNYTGTILTDLQYPIPSGFTQQ